MAGEIGAEADRNWYSMGGAETRLKEAVMKFNRLSESTNEKQRPISATIAGPDQGGLQMQTRASGLFALQIAVT